VTIGAEFAYAEWHS